MCGGERGGLGGGGGNGCVGSRSLRLDGRNLRTGGLRKIGRTGTVEGPTVDQSTSSRSAGTGRWPSLVDKRPR